VKIVKALASACEFVDHDIFAIYGHKVFWGWPEEGYASEVGEVSYISGTAIDTDEAITQPHHKESRFQVDLVDE
jgi:hypothetical protein